MAVGSKNSGGIHDPKGYRVRAKGTHYATITLGQTQNIDYQIEQLSWLSVNKQSYFDGVEYYAKDANLGDKITFQVIDKDGLVYPQGTVLEEFADIYVMPDIKNKYIFYKAKLIAGMYIRLIYSSTGSTNVDLICNIFRHLNANEDV